jgi:hypothetical protein
MSPYCCSACGWPTGCITEPYRCHRTGQTAQPHLPVTGRSAPKPPADRDPDRGRRATRRRRRKASPNVDQASDAKSTVAPVDR